MKSAANPAPGRRREDRSGVRALAIHEPEEERQAKQDHADQDEPAALQRHACESRGKAGGRRPDLELEDPEVWRHFFRNAAIAVRKSGVVRLSALTSADSRTPSSNPVLSSRYSCCLVSASAVALNPARLRSNRAACSSNVSSVHTRETSPDRSASLASSSRPVAARSSASSSPTARRSMFMTSAGTKPRCTSG